MSKSKIDFVNTIELKVKDIAGEFVKTAVIKSLLVEFNPTRTIFTVDTVKDIFAGDIVYIYDGTAKVIASVYSVNSTDKKITIAQNLSTVLAGGVIKKSDAFMHIDEAMTIYSKLKPCTKIKQLSGSGSSEYSVPEDWVNGMSQIISVEYPISLIPETYLKENEYKVYQANDNSFKIKFSSVIPSGQTAYVKYTTNYIFSNDSATSPDNDFYAICNIAAYKYLLSLAARYGQSVSPLIKADNVDYNSKTDSYRRLAKEYLGQAASWLGISIKSLESGELSTEAASSVQYEDVSEEEKRLIKY